MIKRLTDEKIISLVTAYHLSGEQNRHILARKAERDSLLNAMRQVRDNLHILLAEGLDKADFKMRFLSFVSELESELAELEKEAKNG